MSIADLDVGQSAVIESVDAAAEGTRRRLLSLGLVPGERVTVEQRFPAYVVRVGWTRIALDHETAAVVLVSKDDPRS